MSVRTWTPIFVCRQKGHDPAIAKEVVNCLLEQGAKYNFYNGRYRYVDSEGEIAHGHEKVPGDPDGSKLARALELVTARPGGSINLEFPVVPGATPGISYEDEGLNWEFLDVNYLKQGILFNLQIDNFIFLYNFHTGLPSWAPDRLDSERGKEKLRRDESYRIEVMDWEEEVGIKIPRLVELCKHTYTRLRPYLVTIIPALEVWDNTCPKLTPFNLFSPEIVDKIGREKIKSCPWWKCETLDDGGLECWTEQFLRYFEHEQEKEVLKLLGVNELAIFEIAGNL